MMESDDSDSDIPEPRVVLHAYNDYLKRSVRRFVKGQYKGLVEGNRVSFYCEKNDIKQVEDLLGEWNTEEFAEDLCEHTHKGHYDEESCYYEHTAMSFECVCDHSMNGCCGYKYGVHIWMDIYRYISDSDTA